MRKLMHVLLAALLVVAPLMHSTSAFAASVGNPFLKGVKNPTDLANRFDASLAIDETGKTMLDAKRCKRDGSCARPIDYLPMLQKADSQAGLTHVSQIPGYLRKLVAVDPPKGEHWMACLIKAGNGWTPKFDCLKRKAKPGEKWWANPVTGKVVLAQDCTNPIGQPGEPCYIIEFGYEQLSTKVMIEGSAIVSAHTSLTVEQLNQLWWNNCFFVQDESGTRKPRIDCGLLCPPGSVWPDVVLARAAGIPGEAPPSTFWFDLKDGKGRLSLPRSVLDDLWVSVFCVYVEPYPITISDRHRGWGAIARFNVVQRQELVTTRSAGRLNRVLRGEQHY